MNEQSRIPGWLRDAAGAPPEGTPEVPEKLKTAWRVVTWLRRWWGRRRDGAV
jgi:hypothetical protein